MYSSPDMILSSLAVGKSVVISWLSSGSPDSDGVFHAGDEKTPPVYLTVYLTVYLPTSLAEDLDR